jgi:hypothetical protein
MKCGCLTRLGPALLPEVIEPLPHPLKVVPPLRVARIERGKPGTYGEAGLIRGPGCGKVPGTHRNVADFHAADGQVALPPGAAGIGAGPPEVFLLHGLRQPGGGRQVTRIGERAYLQIGDDAPRVFFPRDQRAGLGKVGADGQGSGQETLDGVAGAGGDRVEAAQGRQVTGDVDEVVVPGPALIEAAVPHRQGPFMQGSGADGGRPGDEARCPRVHLDVRAGSQQRQVGEVVDVGLQPGKVRIGRFILAVQGEGQVGQAHRPVAHGHLVRDRRLPGCQQREELIQQDVGAAEQHRVVQRGFPEGSRGPGSLPAWLPGRGACAERGGSRRSRRA